MFFLRSKTFPLTRKVLPMQLWKPGKAFKFLQLVRSINNASDDIVALMNFQMNECVKFADHEEFSVSPYKGT